MKIKMCGDGSSGCVQITDLSSGITVVGTGPSSQVSKLY